MATTTVRLGRVLVQELEMDPYLSIDMARFPVLAAVPGEGEQPAVVTGTLSIVPDTNWWCYLLCKPHNVATDSVTVHLCNMATNAV